MACFWGLLSPERQNMIKTHYVGAEMLYYTKEHIKGMFESSSLQKD